MYIGLLIEIKASQPSTCKLTTARLKLPELWSLKSETKSNLEVQVEKGLFPISEKLNKHTYAVVYIKIDICICRLNSTNLTSNQTKCSNRTA